jgi:hypothetical protein
MDKRPTDGSPTREQADDDHGNTFENAKEIEQACARTYMHCNKVVRAASMTWLAFDKERDVKFSYVLQT